MKIVDAVKRMIGKPSESDKQKSLSTLIQMISQAGMAGGQPPSLEAFVWQHNTQVWVYRCIRVKVNAAVRMTPRVFRLTSKNGIKRREELLPGDHGAARIIHQPNPWDNHSTLAEKIWTSLGVAGMYYFFYDEGKGELWHLRPDKMEILSSEKEFISAFRFTSQGQRQEFAPSKILYGKYYNPNDERYGLSPMRAASTSISSSLRAQLWNLNFFKNSAMPLGLLTTDYHFNNQDEIDLVRKNWDLLYKGWDKWGGTAIVGGGLKYETVTPTHKDMLFTELLGKAKEEISSAFGVPMLFLNDSAGVNYANAREYERILWRETMIPEKILVEQAFNKFLNTNFARSGETLELVLDISQVEALKDDIVKEAEASRVRIHSGQRTIDEEREADGLAPYPDGSGSKPLFQMSFVPLDQVGSVFGPQRVLTAAGRAHKASMLPDAEGRLKHWTATKGLIERLDSRAKRIIMAIFTDWREEMLRRLGDKSAKDITVVEDYLFDLEAGKLVLERTVGPILQEATETGGNRALAMVGEAKSIKSFDMHDPRVAALLAEATKRFRDHVADATWERMKESLVEGIRAGEPMKQLRARVTEQMGHEINNAGTIARTEVLPRYHEGQLEGYRQSEVVEQKEWLSAFTETSRDEHVGANGQTVPLDGYFDVGGEMLQYPGDPGGSAENIINCLCDMLPVIDEQKRARRIFL